MRIIEKNLDTIKALCKKHKVAHLFAFGSVLTSRFSSTSDVDLLVDFENVELYDYADNYFDFKQSLEHLLKREVDLMEDSAIKNPFLRQSIDANKYLIYG